MNDTVSIPLRVPEPAPASPWPQHRGTPCTMVILGARGDLTRRKLVPALFHLMNDGLLADDFSVIGVGRRPMSNEAFRASMHDALTDDGGDAPDAAAWKRFADCLEYIDGDLEDDSTYVALGERLSALESTDADDREGRGRLFYFALPPSTYTSTLVHLSESGLAPRTEDAEQQPWVRLIIEKPFGHSLESAQSLNQVIRAHYAEHQIFRIDHYLGKETVQNILVFRFANSIFEPIWNRDHIHHVQITAAESVGVGHRAGFYEEAGVVRDMFQNHLLQLLALTAMEPPSAFGAEAVRNEKVKVFDAIHPITGAAVERNAVIAQYVRGHIDGEPVRGYREEDGVAPDSATPTYAAVRLAIDNWRWQGVPFFLRSGKRMPRRATEIAIQFRRPPHLMFPRAAGQEIGPNVLVFRIQPDEGISLCFEVKVPDHDFRMATADMEFSYAAGFGPSQHSAYETLLIDCMLGDATLFTRSDGAEAAWRVIDPIIEGLGHSATARLAQYAAGEWGPEEADALIRRDGAAWRKP